ncbi:UNVERIFIED_ORG: hypothetical protein ABIB52_000723 [Arthrobacter sp. UYCu721]
MSGSTYTINSVYHPTDGTGTIRIAFHDLRKSSQKQAEILINEQIARILKDRPANTVITACLIDGKRFASSWSYTLSTAIRSLKTAKPVYRAPRTTKYGAPQHV